MTEWIYLAAVLAVAVYLFWSQRVRTDVTALLVLLATIVPWPRPGGEWESVLTYEQGFAGFGSSAVIIISAMFVISGAIVQTGAAEALGLLLLRRVTGNEWLMQATVLVASTIASMFINDTTVVLIMMPVLLSVCREHDILPARYLMFAAYGSLLGGQWTLIGTRSNIILSDFLRTQTGSGIAFFDFAWVAAPVFVVAAAFFLLIGRRFLPKTQSSLSQTAMKKFFTELKVAESSGVSGVPLGELENSVVEAQDVIAVIRDGTRQRKSVKIQEGDVLVVRGTAERIGRMIKSPDFEVWEEEKLEQAELAKADLVTVEAVVPTHSFYAGLRMSDLPVEDDYGVTVVGVAHRGRSMPARVTRARLEPGDSLLLIGGNAEVERLREDGRLLLLSAESLPAASRRKAVVMALLIAGVILASMTDVLSPAVSIPLAATAAVLLSCISLREAYTAIHWPTLVTLGGMISYGVALEETGATEAIAEWTTTVCAGANPVIVLGAILLIALVFTQLIENAAVAIIMAPVTVDIAGAMGLDPKAILIPLGVVISAGFATPVAHESTILVMGPGGYEFKHYFFIGGAMALLTWIVSALASPLLWPLG